MDHILIDRENRKNIIKSLIEHNKVLIVLKTTLPGEDKKRIPCRIINNLLRERLETMFDFEKCQYLEDFDGLMSIYTIPTTDYSKVKKITIELEETHPLGRYVDIDVYYQNEVPLSRTSFGKKMRKCYLCDNYAVICSRNKTHKVDELLNKIINDTKIYIKSFFEEKIRKSLCYELILHPKFGLVTKYSVGSHSDMNYQLMLEAINVITPYLADMAVIGAFNNIESICCLIKEVGLVAEAEMLKKTHGVNAYKGMIYIMGFTCAALGFQLSNNNVDFSGIVKKIGENELSYFQFLTTFNTFGEKSYQKYGFYGARGEVSKGLKIIEDVYSIIKDVNLDDNQVLLHRALVYIVGNIDDTVLLKRSITLDKYLYYKNLVACITDFNIDNLNIITEECINDNISFGGASDILASAILYKLVKEGLSNE